MRGLTSLSADDDGPEKSVTASAQSRAHSFQSSSLASGPGRFSWIRLRRDLRRYTCSASWSRMMPQCAPFRDLDGWRCSEGS